MNQDNTTDCQSYQHTTLDVNMCRCCGKKPADPRNDYDWCLDCVDEYVHTCGGG